MGKKFNALFISRAVAIALRMISAENEAKANVYEALNDVSFWDFLNLQYLDYSSLESLYHQKCIIIRTSIINFEFILLIMNLLNSRYAYSYLILEFLNTSL